MTKSLLISRLGHVADNFKGVEAKVEQRDAQISALEDEIDQMERDKAGLKGQLAAAKGEIEALKIESSHEQNKLTHKVVPRQICRQNKAAFR